MEATPIGVALYLDGTLEQRRCLIREARHQLRRDQDPVLIYCVKVQRTEIEPSTEGRKSMNKYEIRAQNCLNTGLVCLVLAHVAPVGILWFALSSINLIQYVVFEYKNWKEVR
mgnify:CR=1 FL=1